MKHVHLKSLTQRNALLVYVLQSTDRFTDLYDKKSLFKDKIYELLLLVDKADSPDGITIATRHVNTGIHVMNDLHGAYFLARKTKCSYKS